MVKIDPLRPGAAALPGAKRTGKKQQSSVGDETSTGYGGIPDNLAALVEEINSTGEELGSDPSGHQLEKYKAVVRKFLDAAVNESMRVTSEKSLGLSRKVFATIARVDVSLSELADNVLGRQQDALKIKEIIDQIKGLLVDLYR